MQGQLYTFRNDGVLYTSTDTLLDLGVAADSVSAVVDTDPFAAFCCIDDDRFLKRAKQQDGVGSQFLTVAAAIRALPPFRDRILRRLCPGRDLPSLPTYAVNGCAGTWVTTVDLARCAGLDGGDILGSLGISTSRKAKCFAFVDSDGTLTKAGTCRARGCGAMVTETWLRRAPAMAAVRAMLAPACPGVPIAMAASPATQQVASRPKRPRDEGGTRICSVKMTATSRLKDAAAREFLEVVVDTVSHASRFGSYLLNLHVMRLLDASGGVLSDTPSDQPFCLSKLARKAMAAVRCKQPKDAALATTFARHPVLASLVNTDLPDVGNVLSHEALDYVRNAYTSLQEAGPSRLRGLIKATVTCLGVTQAALPTPGLPRCPSLREVELHRVDVALDDADAGVLLSVLPSCRSLLKLTITGRRAMVWSRGDEQSFVAWLQSLAARARNALPAM